MTRFAIDLPALPTGSLDRSEDVREPTRLRERWQSARMLPLGRDGLLPTRTGADGVLLDFAPAALWGEEPVPGATVLGSLGGVDYWTVPHWVSRRTGVPVYPSGAGDGDGSFASMRAVGPLLSETDAALAMTAVALTTWHTTTAFCGRCGRPTVPDLSGHSRLCPAGHQEFPRTDPAVIVLVHDDDGRAVLARQPSWAPGRFSVLAGFAEAGESLEATVEREIGEEIGVSVSDVDYLGSQPWPFPRSLMIAFAARAPRGVELRPRPGEIAEARWFSQEELRALVAQAEALGDTAATRDRRVAGSGAEVGGSGQPGALTDVPAGGGPGNGHGAIMLPGRLSIARRMVEGFVNAG